MTDNLLKPIALSPLREVITAQEREVVQVINNAIAFINRIPLEKKAFYREEAEKVFASIKQSQEAEMTVEQYREIIKYYLYVQNSAQRDDILAMLQDKKKMQRLREALNILWIEDDVPEEEAARQLTHLDTWSEYLSACGEMVRLTADELAAVAMMLDHVTSIMKCHLAIFSEGKVKQAVQQKLEEFMAVKMQIHSCMQWHEELFIENHQDPSYVEGELGSPSKLADLLMQSTRAVTSEDESFSEVAASLQESFAADKDLKRMFTVSEDHLARSNDVLVPLAHSLNGIFGRDFIQLKALEWTDASVVMAMPDYICEEQKRAGSILRYFHHYNAKSVPANALTSFDKLEKMQQWVLDSFTYLWQGLSKHAREYINYYQNLGDDAERNLAEWQGQSSEIDIEKIEAAAASEAEMYEYILMTTEQMREKMVKEAVRTEYEMNGTQRSYAHRDRMRQSRTGDNPVPELLKKDLTMLYDLLDSEIKELNAEIKQKKRQGEGCFSFFNASLRAMEEKKAIKEAKKQALGRLKEVSDLEELVVEAEAVQAEPLVTKGFFSETRRVLDRIANYPKEQIMMRKAGIR